jgi:hypothetical protein
MSTYYPDSWKIVVIDSVKHGKVYKVLASWYGGFTQGDSWKLSSGIESMQITEGKYSERLGRNSKIYTMPQASGSVYVLYENCEHISGIMSGVFRSFADEAENSNGAFTIQMVEIADLPAVFP